MIPRVCVASISELCTKHSTEKTSVEVERRVRASQTRRERLQIRHRETNTESHIQLHNENITSHDSRDQLSSCQEETNETDARAVRMCTAVRGL